MIPIRVRFLTLSLTFDVKMCSVVAGCPFKEPNDPGNLQIDWLEVQLEEYRNRGMQV
jgi:endopolyphosphatase